MAPWSSAIPWSETPGPESDEEDEEEEECPRCDDIYVMVNSIHRAAEKHGNDFAQAIISGDTDEYNELIEKDYFELDEQIYLGDGLSEAKRNGQKYRFTMDNIPILEEGEVKMLKTWINDIYRQTDKSKMNIERVEKIARAENQTGGNRPEGTIRFRNSDGQHIGNMWIIKNSDAKNFWKTHFTNIRNTAFISSLMAHDRANGTKLAEKYKNTTYGIIK